MRSWLNFISTDNKACYHISTKQCVDGAELADHVHRVCTGAELDEPTNVTQPRTTFASRACFLPEKIFGAGNGDFSA